MLNLLHFFTDNSGLGCLGLISTKQMIKCLAQKDNTFFSLKIDFIYSNSIDDQGHSYLPK